MATFDQLKLAPQAKVLVDQLLKRATTADQAKVKDALVKAAGTDGNRVLSLVEVSVLTDAFEKAAPGGGPLNSTALGNGLTSAYVNLAKLESDANIDGVSAHFTFQESLAAKLISELNDSVKRANGRPMDVNMMIFEFQSDSIEKAITDIAKNNPNVTFRIIGDSGQASSTGGNALPSLLKQSLPNVQVKFKKDFPYTWSDSAERPVYNHTVSAGLNHHKGFSTFIDGKPDRLVTGSFNWSDTADTKNYEDLTVYSGDDAAARRGISQYGAEFAGFWNNPDAALTPNAFANFKGQKWNDMMIAHGKAPTGSTNRPPDPVAAYAVPQDTKSFDVNGWRPEDVKRMQGALGVTLANTVISERKKFGRYESMEALIERVPSVAKVDKAKVESLFFGSGRVSINVASLEELDAAGFLPNQAAAVVAYRKANGDFESLDDLIKVPGVTAGRIESVRETMTAIDVEGFFNSRPYGSASGGTGYGPDGARKTPVMGADGKVTEAAASVVVGATDSFNRATAPAAISVAMYGLSVSAPEFKALEAAAKRGIPVRLVLNDDFNDGAVDAIDQLAAQGLPIAVRVQSAKTMHEKFAVVGDDVFSGSANFSESSSTKHSEDRFTMKNNAGVAAKFQAQFDALWAKSKIV